MNTRAALVGAALGAVTVLSQSLSEPATPEGVGFVVGKMLVGALFGAWIAQKVMARFSG